MSNVVFISHSSEDRAVVEAEIIPSLNDLGLSPWFSPEQIQTANDFQQSIREALDQCDWFLIVLSANSILSPWVRAEVSLAIERLPHRVIPVKIEACDPSRVHLQLYLRQYIDWFRDPQTARDQLRRAFQSTVLEAGETLATSPGDASEKLVDLLRKIRESRDVAKIGLVFRCLADAEEGVRIRAQQALHAIGWNEAAAAAELLARSGPSSDIDGVLDGLAALESHVEVVKILDRLSNQLSGELRNRAILLWERKTLALRLEHVAQVLKAHHSPLIIEQVLGQGLTAASFLATHQHTKQQVVLRLLRPELASLHASRFEFLDLVVRASRYVHENLVMVRDGGQFPADNFYFYVRDYVPGATLQNLLDKGQPLSPAQILDVVRQVALALRPIHQAGEIHRGIKPSNVFLSTNDRVILGDASLPVASLGLDLKRLAYDFRYAAPETFTAGAPVGPAADFYSLGCLLYQLACGAPPVVSDSPFELARRQGAEPILPPSAQDSPFGTLADELTRWLLQPNPEDRPRQLTPLLMALADLETRLGSAAIDRRPSPQAQPAPAWDQLAPDYSIAGFQHPGDVYQSIIQTDAEEPLPPERSEVFTPVSSPVTNEDILGSLLAMGLLSEKEAGGLRNQAANLGDVGAVVRLLVEQRRLTPYQASVLRERRGEPLVLGDYIIVDRIGEGGMGSVYKAFHRRMQRTVAIKVLSHSATSRDESHQRFRREIMASARLNHPNIVSAYDAGEHEGQPYLVMEYVEGQDVAARVREAGPLPIAEAVNYGLQTAQGLAYAHKHGIIHRDIKPQNLIRTEAGQIKILDLGLARLNEQIAEQAAGLTITGMIMGTPQYMAPEQALNTLSADQRADVYSLGCTLFFALTAQPVYSVVGRSPLAIFHAHLEEPIPFVRDKRPDVPAELDRVVQTMLAKDPQDRFQSMDEVIEALKPFQGRTDLIQPPQLPPASVKLSPASRSLGSEGVPAKPQPKSLAEDTLCSIEFGPDGFPIASPSKSKTDNGKPPRPLSFNPLILGKQATKPKQSEITWADSPAMATERGLFAGEVPGAKDPVDCTVFAPPDICLGGAALVQVFAHVPADVQAAMARANEADDEATRRGATSLGTLISRGSKLSFELAMDRLRVEEAIQELVWRGEVAAVQFAVRAAADLVPGTSLGTVRVSQDSVPIGTIRFKMTIVGKAATLPPATPQGEAQRYRLAFISYASEDRGEVLRRVQMLKTVGIGVFQDVLHLDPGTRWMQKLYEKILESDVLFLFWSKAAKRSEWVEKEWRYGLNAKGEEFIRPVILEGPPIPEPPSELAHLHFGDPLLYYLLPQLAASRWRTFFRRLGRLFHWA